MRAHFHRRQEDMKPARIPTIVDNSLVRRRSGWYTYKPFYGQHVNIQGRETTSSALAPTTVMPTLTVSTRLTTRSPGRPAVYLKGGGMGLNRGRPGEKKTAGRWSDRSRLTFWPSGVFQEKCHRNALRSRLTAPADLEPPKGLELGLRLGVRVGPGWSWPTCNITIYVHRRKHAGSFSRNRPAFRDRVYSDSAQTNARRPGSCCCSIN